MRDMKYGRAIFLILLVFVYGVGYAQGARSKDIYITALTNQRDSSAAQLKTMLTPATTYALPITTTTPVAVPANQDTSDSCGPHGCDTAGCPKNQYVSGYTRSNGTYVEPYWRNSPNDDC